MTAPSRRPFDQADLPRTAGRVLFYLLLGSILANSATFITGTWRILLFGLPALAVYVINAGGPDRLRRAPQRPRTDEPPWIVEHAALAGAVPGVVVGALTARIANMGTP